MDGKVILAGASFYTLKHYFNDEFLGLPTSIKKELENIIVVLSGKTKGIIVIGFYIDDGSIYIEEQSGCEDFTYDSIYAGLEIRKFEKENDEFFISLTKWFNEVYKNENN